MIYNSADESLKKAIYFISLEWILYYAHDIAFQVKWYSS